MTEKTRTYLVARPGISSQVEVPESVVAQGDAAVEAFLEDAVNPKPAAPASEE